MTVRLRVAPSPTGAPHVGTAYVAIFNLAYARQHHGQFVLRIEDTDRARSETQYETMIFESLRWLGLDWDEGPDVGGPHGPYRQSERSQIYQDHANLLLEKGRAYRCFCTTERLDEVRKAQLAEKAQTMYDRHCRRLGETDIQRQLAAGVPHVIRLAVPSEGEMTFTDLVRGPITIGYNTVDDQVLLKSDGYPTYHLANIVDDHLMEITHVMRAEEWINSTPKHILLYEAFGWTPPQFAHLPLLRNKDRSKIKKRDNPVSLKWYEEEGYLPEAMINFLGLMGYSMPQGKEEFTFPDIRDTFDFKRINPAGPVFDLEKLDWLNGVYIRKLSDAELSERLLHFGFKREQVAYMQQILPLVRDRMKKLKDFADITDYFFKDEVTPDVPQLIPKKRTAAETAPIVLKFADLLESLGKDEWNKETIETRMRTLTEELGWATKESFMAVRVAVTGKTATPPLVESIVVLGAQRTAQRLRQAASKLHDAA